MRKAAITLLLCLAFPAYGRAACVPTSATSQRCDYTLSWDYQQSSDPAAQAVGFIMQQEQNNDGNWYDIDTTPGIPITQQSLADGWDGDLGNRTICWRVFAYNDAGRSDPSNVVCQTSPVVDAIGIKTAATMTVSNRDNDNSSIIAILINKDANIGPGGLEIVYPTSKVLTVSRRATNTSSIIAVLVNKSTKVFINP